jgi:hypothetical protein
MDWDDAKCLESLSGRFRPVPSNVSHYQRRIDLGRREMASSTCAVVGLARNLEGHLPATIERIERLGAAFADYRVFVYENDSSDLTPDMLKVWAAANERVHVRSEQLGDPTHPPLRCLTRAASMASYRTQCQQYVRDNWAGVDYVCVLDLDLTGGWLEDGVAHTFGSPGWDFVGSYGVIVQRRRLSPYVPLHYDTWAYRFDGSYDEVSGREGNRMSWRLGDPLQPVYSCFGGMGFYRTEAFLSSSYGGEDCEHVVLHRQMRQRGYDRQFLNPSQLTLYGRKAKRWDPVVIAIDRVQQRLRRRSHPEAGRHVA